ncbi:MAG: hypothetical protein PF904_21710 [Kiritimatiellae bacterium]|jgi:transketolase|nr:hypothetical protein [Kiritimatiellia bacterium]
MNKKNYAVAAMVLGGLLVGASVEHLRLSGKAPDVNIEEPEIIHHVQKVARESNDKAQDALIASLRAKIDGLAAELDALRVEKEKLAVMPIEKNDNRGRDRKRESWNDRMERMKKEEPDKYAEMQERREEFKARIEERKLNKEEFLTSIKTDSMSDEQIENHERLMALTDRVNEIMENMMSGETENRHELRKEMFESFGELSELNNNERNYLLKQTATAVGYEGEEAEVFTQYVEEIIQNTTMSMPGPPGGGRRGR